MDDDEDYYYRNAGRDHRPGGGGGAAPWQQGRPRPGQMVPQQPPQQMYQPPQQPAAYYYPPPPPPASVSLNLPAFGRLLQAAAPVVVAMLPLPTPPVAITATGDIEANVKGALTNQANQITYQQAVASSFKRDEAWYAIAVGLGMLMEKGLTA
jgi:hypothetical protein